MHLPVIFTRGGRSPFLDSPPQEILGIPKGTLGIPKGTIGIPKESLGIPKEYLPFLKPLAFFTTSWTTGCSSWLLGAKRVKKSPTGRDCQKKSPKDPYGDVFRTS